MKKKTIIFCLVFMILISCLVACTPKQNIRDMSEVAVRGSFVMAMNNNEDKIPADKTTLVFNTYDEFCKNSLSEAVLFSRYDTVDGKYTNVEYQAKNERYQAEFFEQNNLLITFFDSTDDVLEQIITDVDFVSEAECKIQIVARLMSDEKINNVKYACFIEVTKSLSQSINATVEVKTFITNSSTSINFSDGVGEDTESIKAYAITSTIGLESWKNDNEFINDSSSLMTTIGFKYTEEFFEQNDLLVLELPGKYFGYYSVNENAIVGIRLDITHYEVQSSIDFHNGLTKKAVAVLLTVSKDFNLDELSFSFRGYFEWDEDVQKNAIQSGEITLVCAENEGKDYLIYSQQG